MSKGAGRRFGWLSGQRKRSIEEVILMLLCALTIPSILPFGVYRLVQRQWLSAAVDLALVLAMLAVIVHVWRTGRHRVAGFCVTLFYSAGLLATVYLRGISLIYWVYPTMIACYFVLRPRVAVAINSVTLVALVAILVSQMAVLNLLTIIVTIGLVNLFAYIFAYRTGEQNKALHTEVELDFLTGIGNRRALDRKLAEHADERRPQLPACLLLLDLDHFKQVNDTHGHAAGDQALRRLAEVMRLHTRSTDRLFRYGGEEFAVIANGAGLNAASRLADNLRAAVAGATLIDGHPLTVSIGVAFMDKRGTPAGWLEQADTMLYAAKQGGRDTVRVAVAEPVSDYAHRA
ncbi:GGDEF domain-containing protein [Duganella vulcania]|uniref:diguanylate cyclase n=1 Tax=Duganella vulcania TaxID=2692166 RepID=A0A845GTM8_9BURK|nr:GGDEF domain-containing protein [Duganella vulcania]MYM96588.1 diguanylate cyclase [Duganella vulcania]